MGRSPDSTLVVPFVTATTGIPLEIWRSKMSQNGLSRWLVTLVTLARHARLGPSVTSSGPESVENRFLSL